MEQCNEKISRFRNQTGTLVKRTKLAIIKDKYDNTTIIPSDVVFYIRDKITLLKNVKDETLVSFDSCNNHAFFIWTGVEKPKYLSKRHNSDEIHFYDVPCTVSKITPQTLTLHLQNPVIGSNDVTEFCYSLGLPKPNQKLREYLTSCEVQINKYRDKTFNSLGARLKDGFEGCNGVVSLKLKCAYMDYIWCLYILELQDHQINITHPAIVDNKEIIRHTASSSFDTYDETKKDVNHDNSRQITAGASNLNASRGKEEEENSFNLFKPSVNINYSVKNLLNDDASKVNFHNTYKSSSYNISSNNSNTEKDDKYSLVNTEVNLTSGGVKKDDLHNASTGSIITQVNDTYKKQNNCDLEIIYKENNSDKLLPVPEDNKVINNCVVTDSCSSNSGSTTPVLTSSSDSTTPVLTSNSHSTTPVLTSNSASPLPLDNIYSGSVSPYSCDDARFTSCTSLISSCGDSTNTLHSLETHANFGSLCCGILNSSKLKENSTDSDFPSKLDETSLDEDYKEKTKDKKHTDGDYDEIKQSIANYQKMKYIEQNDKEKQQTVKLFGRNSRIKKFYKRKVLLYTNSLLALDYDSELIFIHKSDTYVDEQEKLFNKGCGNFSLLQGDYLNGIFIETTQEMHLFDFGVSSHYLALLGWSDAQQPDMYDDVVKQWDETLLKTIDINMKEMCFDLVDQDDVKDNRV